MQKNGASAMTTRPATHAVSWSRAPGGRRTRAVVVLASGWLALTAALVLGPCCATYAAAPATSPATHADAHGEHAPAPCDPWFTQQLDLNGPVPAPAAGGPDVKALVFKAAAPPPALTARSLSSQAPVHGPDPPRPIYLTLLRLLM